MNFLFNNTTNYNIDKKTIDLIKKAIKTTLHYENFNYNVEISFSIVSNAEIKEINNKFRNIDKKTDVLSFPLIDDFKTIDMSLQIINLGDIIISIEQAIFQAKEYGHSLEREIAFLTVHSMLHLLGYDHIEKNEEKIMFFKQKEILKNLNILR